MFCAQAEDFSENAAPPPPHFPYLNLLAVSFSSKYDMDDSVRIANSKEMQLSTGCAKNTDFAELWVKFRLVDLQ